MSMTTQRARRGAPSKASTPASTRGDVYSGSSARDESERVVAEAKKRQAEAGKMPFRFYLDVGDEKSFIILDDEPTFLRWEHEEWDGRNKKMLYHGCIAATDNCPACDSLEYRSYFAMYLTIIDLTEFTTKKGDHIPFSKKLLVVKQNQHKLFWRKFDKAGSLRGMLFDTFRDKKTDARIGGVIELSETLTDDELQDYVREYEDRDGKAQTESVDPYDYLDLFSEVTRAGLEKTFGVKPQAGSAKDIANELEDQFDGDDSDSTDSGSHRPRQQSTRRGIVAKDTTEGQPFDADPDTAVSQRRNDRSRRRR